MEEFSFNASNFKDQTVIIDSEYVKKALQPLLVTTERSKYIL